MKTLEVLLPVITMLLIGMFCRKKNFLSSESIVGLKFLTTKIILPVAVFNALATAHYNSSTWIIVGIMLLMLVVSFSLGFVLRVFIKEPYKKYVPFMASVYEGGMIAYPLFANLCGVQNLSSIALLDIAGLIFGFSIYMGLLTQIEGDEKISIKKICLDALKNPTFIAAVLGLIFGLCKIIIFLQTTSFSATYNAIIKIITAPLSSIILIVVGYEICPKKEMLSPCIKMILIRALLQATMIFLVLVAVHKFTNANKIMDIAIITYMSSPATFSMQTFLKTKEGSAFVSTTNSLYCFVSIFVYAIVAVVML